MSNDFATAMRRALARTHAADPSGAMAIIREALGDPSPIAAPAEATCGRGRPVFEMPGGFGAGPRRAAAPGRKAPVPEGARFDTRRYGARSCRVFVPSCGAERAVGTVLMLHGCTQNPDDFALGTGMNLAAERRQFAVVYPAQTAAENPQSCWNWFRPEDQRRDGGEPETLATIMRQFGAEFGLAGRQMFAAGLSAGRAMAAILARTHPDVFGAVGVHSGLPAGSARDVPSAFAAMRQGPAGPAATGAAQPMIVFHGTADRTVAPVNGARLVAGDGIETEESGNGRRWSRLVTTDGSELLRVEGGGHAWFGGDPAGSFADPSGPRASDEMLRFFGGAANRR